MAGAVQFIQRIFIQCIAPAQRQKTDIHMRCQKQHNGPILKFRKNKLAPLHDLKCFAKQTTLWIRALHTTTTWIPAHALQQNTHHSSTNFPKP